MATSQPQRISTTSADATDCFASMCRRMRLGDMVLVGIRPRPASNAWPNVATEFRRVLLIVSAVSAGGRLGVRLVQDYGRPEDADAPIQEPKEAGLAAEGDLSQAGRPIRGSCCRGPRAGLVGLCLSSHGEKQPRRSATIIPARFGPEHLDLPRLRHEREPPAEVGPLPGAMVPASTGPAAAPVTPGSGGEKRKEPDLLMLANLTAARLDALEQRMARRFEAMTVTLAQALAEVITTELRRR